MTILKTLFPSLLFLLIMGTAFAIAERKDLMDKFIREKNTFSVAIQELQNGKVIRRAGDRKTYAKIEIKYPDHSKIQYGTLWSGGDFLQGARFDLEDVLAEDWIVEEKK